MDEKTKTVIIDGNFGIASHSMAQSQVGSEIQDLVTLKVKETQEQLYELTRQGEYQTEFLSGREKRKNRRKQERDVKKRTRNV